MITETSRANARPVESSRNLRARSIDGRPSPYSLFSSSEPWTLIYLSTRSNILSLRLIRRIRNHRHHPTVSDLLPEPPATILGVGHQRLYTPSSRLHSLVEELGGMPLLVLVRRIGDEGQGQVGVDVCGDVGLVARILVIVAPSVLF